MRNGAIAPSVSSSSTARFQVQMTTDMRIRQSSPQDLDHPEVSTAPAMERHSTIIPKVRAALTYSWTHPGSPSNRRQRYNAGGGADEQSGGTGDPVRGPRSRGDAGDAERGGESVVRADLDSDRDGPLSKGTRCSRICSRRLRRGSPDFPISRSDPQRGIMAPRRPGVSPVRILYYTESPAR